MRSIGFLGKMVVAGVLASFVSAGTVSAQAPPDTRGGGSGVEVLTDTQGVDFGPYLKVVLGQVRKAWAGLLPAEARAPVNEASLTVIRFTIEPDGRVSAMHLERSDRKVDFDRAAWGGIAQAGSLPPLPEGFTGKHLELRVNFAVNQRPAAAVQP